MYKFTYNGIELAFCKPNEFGNEYHSIILLSNGKRIEGVQKPIARQFLLTNGFKEQELDDKKNNTTHIYCRRCIQKLEKDPNPIMTISGPEVAIDSSDDYIDFNFVMKYIDSYGDMPYKSIDRAIDENEKKQIIDIQENAKKAVDETKKMAGALELKFGLDSWKPSKWMDGSNTKVRDYLWVKMKKKKYENDIESISIFVNKGNPSLKGREHTRIRFSLEMVNDGADQSAYDRHHKSLDLPLEDGLCYVIGSDELHDAAIVNEDQHTVEEKVKNGTYKKVQISKVINYDERLSNEEIFREMIDGVSKLIPYYEHVLGNKQKDSYPEDNKEEKEENKVSKSNKKLSLNNILYGPPGTGKTYNSKSYAVAICNYDGDIEKVKQLDYETEVLTQYNKLVEEGRVGFTTFHQSYGYEEFIEGIKPVLKDDDSKDVYYDVVPGTFKKFCEDAVISKQNIESLGIDENAQIWKMSLSGGKTNILKECFDENYLRIGFGIDSNDSSLIIFRDEMRAGDIVLSLKSFYEINGIAQILDDDIVVLENKSEFKVARRVKWLFKDVVVNIKDINAGYRLPIKTCSGLPRINRAEVFKLINRYIQTKISNNKENDVVKPYVFIIDEINRGNISKIFGELITLIEPSKREGAEEAMSCILPYSHQKFSVPNNVYILGTMNTADRSIALMDTALRRRFDFIEMMPETKPLEGLNVDGINIDTMLETLNKRIEVLYDREHTLGHAFFMPLNKEPNIETLASIFKNKIIPLLQEYFYEDYEKIQLVLGDNGKDNTNFKFIKDEEIKVNTLFKGKYDGEDLPEKKYSINEEALYHPESYKQIY